MRHRCTPDGWQGRAPLRRRIAPSRCRPNPKGPGASRNSGSPSTNRRPDQWRTQPRPVSLNRPWHTPPRATPPHSETQTLPSGTCQQHRSYRCHRRRQHKLKPETGGAGGGLRVQPFARRNQGGIRGLETPSSHDPTHIGLTTSPHTKQKIRLTEPRHFRSIACQGSVATSREVVEISRPPGTRARAKAHGAPLSNPDDWSSPSPTGGSGEPRCYVCCDAGRRPDTIT